jgi:uncharacterized delta-60 repeat protein
VRATQQVKERCWLACVAVACLVAGFICPSAALAAPGDLDPSFGSSGLRTINFGPGPSSARAVASQRDGKVVTVGNTGGGTALVRHNPDGSLDASFGDGGRQIGAVDDTTLPVAPARDVVVQDDGKILVAGGQGVTRYNIDGSPDTNFEPVPTSEVNAVALQEDGKVVVGGYGFDDDLRANFLVARYNPDGSLDAAFGNGGIQLTNLGSFAIAHAVAVQEDGKIVVAGLGATGEGGQTGAALVRYEPDGSLDSGFGDQGRVVTDPSGAWIVNDLAVQEDGRIVAVGQSGTDFALARYGADGSLDASFGEGGRQTTEFGAFTGGASAVELQRDGKIVVAGGGGFAMARYEADGSLDVTFGEDGKQTTDFEDGPPFATDMALDGDGGIVVVGGQARFSIARYGSDGILDPVFSEDGRQTAEFDGSDSAKAVAIQPDGTIVAVGTNGFGCLAGGRLAPDGSLLASFGDDPGQNADCDGLFRFGVGAVVQPDGKIVAVGASSSQADGYSDFFVARYDPDGSLDPGFGDDGVQTTNFGVASIDVPLDVVLQPDGKIVVAGQTDPQDETSRSAFALARYNVDGSLDVNFGDGGKQVTQFEGGSAVAHGVALQQDGKIVAVGETGGDFAVVRYNPDGSPDGAFGSGGQQTTEFGDYTEFGEYAIATDVALQADGRIVVVGAGYGFGGRFLLARYDADGTLDPQFGSGGRQATNFERDGLIGGAATGVAIQQNGKILAVGDNRGDFALARYEADGSLDSGFGDGGRQTTDVGGLFSSGLYNSGARAVALQDDGAAVVVGAGRGKESPDFAVARYQTADAGDDTTAPAPTVTVPADGARTGESTVSLAGRAGQADGDLPEVTVSVRSAGGFGRELAVTVDAEGRWNTSLEGLTSDDYEVVVRQTDEDGNVGESEPSTFTVDRLPPEPVIDRPFDGAVIADAEPTIGGTAGTQTGDEEEVVIEVERVVGEGLERAESIEVAVRDGSWSVDSPTLTDGTYEVRVRQSDDVGNEGTSPARRFTVDTQAPTPTISEPGEASTVGRRPALRGEAGRVAGDAGEVRVRLSTGNEPSGTLLLLRAVVVTSEGWSTEPPQDLDNGTYTVEVTQRDHAGNLGTDTTTFVVQDLPPEADLELEPTTGELPLRVTATVAGEDPEGAPTTFELDWGDGSSPVRGELPLDGPVVHEYRRAGEFTVALTVSDGSRETVVNRTVDADLAEDLAPAAGDDRVVLAGEPVRFDGRPSRPAVGIEEYRWDFGDGATARGAQVEHTYSQPGEYTATLEIRADGRSRSDNARVTVVDPAAQALAVTVGSDEGVLSGASVLVMLPDGRRVQGTTDGRGVALLRGLPDGTHKVYAYQQGHRPAVATATVAEGRGELSMRLQAGEIAATSLESRRLTRDEIVALGIDPDAPENQHVYEFVTVLAVGPDTDVQVSGRVNSSGFVGTPRGFSCDGRTCTGSAGGSTIDITAGSAGGGRVPTLQSLVIPGRATFLKEFYEVSLIVQNLAEPEFVFTDGTATLDLPGGLSLAPTSQPQALSTELPDVPGGGSASATWIIRGDQEGSYDFSARYDATLRPFDEAFSVVAELAEPLKVWGGSALEMILDVDDSASARFPYRVRVGLENVADVPVYNPGVELLEDGRENYIYQPRQQLRHATDQVAPGETWWTPYYVLVPSASGDIDLERSFVRKIAGDEALDARIAEHPPRYTAETAPELEARTRDDRVVLEWEAVPGATGYAIFSTPDEDTAFSAQPVPARFLGETKAVVDADSEDSQRFYAVSPLVDGRPDMQHPMVQRGAPPDQPFPSAAVQAATPCQVDPPVLQIEAEDPDFELVRLQIRREGSSELLVDEAIGGLTYSDLRVIAEQTPITVAVRVGNREGQWSSWRSIELGQCDYVALGDSYSSGEGALDDDGNVGDGNDNVGYEANTDIEGQNECHRARNAWPRLLDEMLPDLTMQPGGFVACSGAVTANVTDGGSGKGAWGEEAQVESVSGRTDIATISIGGNDAKFSEALETCIADNVLGAVTRGLSLTPVCKLKLALTIRPAIDAAGPKVREVLRDVRNRLPSSGRLLVLRYPPIFPAASLTCDSVSPTDVTWLHYEQQRFNDILARVVADLEAEGGEEDRASVELIDPPSQFFSHTACDTDDRWVNNVEIPDLVHSFHPNAEGQRQLAGAARAAIEDPARQPAMVGPGETVLRSIDVRGALERLTIAARWPGSTVRVSLVAPSGRQIDATTNAGDVERTATGVSESYSIRRPEPGRWTVRLFGQDVDADGEPTRLNTVQVPVTEVRPLALFEPPPADLVAPGRIDLDATDSVAPEGEIAEWRWELGDGATARGSRVSHEYRDAGVYTLKLTVVDDQGRSDTTAVDVVVKEPPAEESSSDDDPQPDDDTETAQPPQAQPPVPQRPTPQTPAPRPTPPEQASPPVEGDPGYLYAAKMRVARARVLREDRELDVFAPLTSRASGEEVDVEFFAAQRRENLTAKVTSGNAELDRIRFREAIPREQARLGTGIITLRYPGNAVTRPQEVRLRAARNQADLEVDEISLQGDRLSAAGVLTDKAEGVVRLELSYLDVAGQPQVFKTNVKIEDGRWSVENVQVPPEIAQTGAYVSALFTGYFERRIRGEMVSYQIFPGQTRRP